MIRKVIRNHSLSTLLTLMTTISPVVADWGKLPALPDELGFAGGFAGVSNDALIFAGGANFPDGPPWEGGVKTWHDSVFVLDDPGGTWKSVGNLPGPRGYGVSVDIGDGLLCIGGSDADSHHADCFLLVWKNNELQITNYPSLPFGLAEMTGAKLGNTVHVVGGIFKPGAVEAENIHLSLDLDDLERGWKQDIFPGAARILAVAAVQDGALFILSGASLDTNEAGESVRAYLKDTWRFDPASGWKQLGDMPRATVAAPTPASPAGASHFMVIGGDDGSRVGKQPPAQHPGFPRGILAFDTLTETWAEFAGVPEDRAPPVTVPVASWRGMQVIVSGEIRPATRTPEVSSLILRPGKAGFGAINWAVVATYLGGMIGVGYWFMKREAASSTEAYFRGGQRIPWWVAGLSIFATMLSSLTFMGIPARAYQTDVSWYLGQLPILIVIPLVALFYLPFFRKLDLTSAYEYLEKRFNYGCRIFAALSFILFHIGRVAIVLYLPALALAAVSDIDVITAILVIGVLCLIYTVIGGIEAVVWTDAIQALVLMGGATLCLILAVNRVDGGISGVISIASEDAKLFQNLRWDSMDITTGTASVLVLFVAFFFNTFVPYTASQDVVQRYVTTRDIAAARRSLWTTMVLSIFGSTIFFALGVAIYAFYKSNPQQMDPTLVATDSILPFFIMRQLPVGVSGLIIAAIFAASQSTISSSLNSVATSWTKDVYARLLYPGREDAINLRSAKRTVLVVGIFGIAVAVWMALSGIQSAFATFNTLIGLTAGSLGGLFALGIFSRSAHGRGALAGALAGFAAVLILHIGPWPVSGLLYACIGCVTSFVSGWLFSKILPRSGGDTLDRCAGLSIRG